MIYSLIQLLFYTHHACYLPYVTIFLMGRDVDILHIGLILGTNSAVIVLAQIFWGIVSDRVGSVRKIFMFCLGVSLVLIFSVTYIQDIWLLTLLFPVISFFLGPLMPLMDNWMSRSLQNRTDISYGATRLWGSISFAVTVALMGRLVSSGGNYALPFRFFSCFSVLTMLLLTRVPDAVPEHRDGTSSFFKHVGKLLMNRRYVIFIFSAALVFMIIMPSLGFLPKYIEFVGGDAGIFGLAMGISAISEVPVFYFGSRLIRRIPPTLLILASMVMFFLRMLICILFPSVPVILISMILQGFGYSLFLTSSLVYVDSLADPSCKATAFLLGSATYSGLSGILGNSAGGAIIEKFGIMTLFQTGGLLTFSMMLLFGFSLAGDLRKKPEA